VFYRKSHYPDNYPKDEQGTRRDSGYGEFMLPENNDPKNGHYKYTISYPTGISSDYAMSSGSVPINYTYTKIDEVNKLNTIDNRGGPKLSKNLSSKIGNPFNGKHGVENFGIYTRGTPEHRNCFAE
jgi:hypothetical protein